MGGCLGASLLDHRRRRRHLLRVIWAAEAVSVFDPDFNENRAVAAEVVISQAIIAFLGVFAVLVASVLGFAYVRRGTRAWLPRAGISSVGALLLLIAWLYLVVPAGSS